MMRGLFKTGAGLFVLALFLIALATSLMKSHGIAPAASREGHFVESDERKVGKDVRSVELNGPINLEIREGSTPSLIVKCEKRLIGNVATEQEGENLRIGISGMLLHHRQPIEVKLVVPELENLVLHTSGDSKVQGFTGEHLQVELHGSGSVKVTGRYKEFVVANHGSGDLDIDTDNANRIVVQQAGSGSTTLAGSATEIHVDQNSAGVLDAEHLTTDEASVDLRGSGSATVHARKSAVMSIRGSGNITVYGQPTERTITRTGSGEVTFMH